MPRSRSALVFLAGFGLVQAGCGEDRSRSEDTGEPPNCAEGHLPDRGSCVPEACGAGPWGDIEVDDATIYVEASAADGGDGSAESPLRGIQQAMDLAGSRGGGRVAVAAGTYPETLLLTTDHADVHLAGRCRELVTLDASVGDDRTSGIDIDTRFGEVEVSGLMVQGSRYRGVLVHSGVVRLEQLGVQGSEHAGIMAYQGTSLAPSVVVVAGCVLEDIHGLGLGVYHPGTELTMQDTEIRDTLPTDVTNSGYGVEASGGAKLRAEGCELVGNIVIGLYAAGRGTQVTLVDTAIRNTQTEAYGNYGYGIDVADEAVLLAQDCELVGNASAGVLALGAGTEVELVDTEIRDTLSDGRGEYGFGINVHSGAVLRADSCELSGNTTAGVTVTNPGAKVSLVDTEVQGTDFDRLVEFGGGIVATDGAALWIQGCTVKANRAVGIGATQPGTQVTAVDTVIRDSWFSDTDVDGSVALLAGSGAVLRTEACELVGNTGTGVGVLGPGTEVTLVETAVRDTRSTWTGEEGHGVSIAQGGTLRAEGCTFAGSVALGLGAWDAGTVVTLVDTTVLHTQPDVFGEIGFGVQVSGGAAIRVEGCELLGNTGSGILADGLGTHALIRDSSIVETLVGYGEQSAAAAGVTVQRGATISASGMRVQASEGPGLYVLGEGASMVCVGCTLLDNAFAAAVVIDEALLELRDSLISGTQEAGDIGGGVGIYAGQPSELGPASLLVVDSDISDHPVAGAWLEGAGSFRLEEVRITGGSGVPHGSTTRCGDGVYATGVVAWDGSEGLLVEASTISDNHGAGLLLDSASAALAGNTWSENNPDLLVQGEACLSPREDWTEAPTSEICPTWERPTCGVSFRLSVRAAEIDPSRPPPPSLLHAATALELAATHSRLPHPGSTGSQPWRW